MDNPREIEAFKKILLNVSRDYRTFSDFEQYVDNLKSGKEKKYLLLARDYMRAKLAKNDRFYNLDRSLIEEILNNAA